MTFLNPAALWGLLALSVPIIVHFFNLQRPRLVLFSNVAFVKEVKRTVVRRVNFQRWLLLLLRLLGLSALVLMFANPVLVDSGKQLLQGARSVVVVIDNSESMKSSNERGEYLRQAISLTRNLVKAYGQEDEFLVTGNSNLALQSGFSGKDETLDLIESISINQNTRSLPEILSVSESLFERATGSVKELYVISDFQKSTMLTDSLQTMISDSSLRITFIPISTRQPANVFVADHGISSKILEADQPLTLTLTLVNDGPTPVKDLNVRVLLEGKVAAISSQSLDAGEKKPVELTFTPGQSGWLNGYIEIDDRPIDFDNKRYFSFYVPAKEPILLIESASSSNVKLLYQDIFKQFETKIISDRSLASVNFADYRGIVWTGLEKISSGLADQLIRFMDAGGSIMIFPGDKINVEEWNQFLKQIGYGSIASPQTADEGLLARSFDLDHPVFQGVFSGKSKRAEPDPIRVFSYYPLSLSGNVAQNKIIQMENQFPLLTESNHGKGHLFLFSVFPGGKSTDLQVKTLFPPLLYRITQLMNQSGDVSLDQEIGSFTPLLVKASVQERIDLRNEAGEIFTPERYDGNEETRLIFDNMALVAGNYDVIQEDKQLLSLSFNVADQESMLAFGSEDDLKELVTEYGLEDQVTILEPSVEVLTDKVQVDREGWSLWRWFLIIGILCLLIEAFVVGGGISLKKSAKATA
ncbi:MAG: BatA domain-containing protein [Bacteroidia bacterium]|nr:BatA domain-containing protein [Bacteroidia bacterium]